MKCPTCKEAKEDCCCSCGSKLSEKELKRGLEPDPYDEEIGNCSDLHLQCDKCMHESCMDI